MHKENNLADFTNSLNIPQLVIQIPYIDLFDSWFVEKQENLREEIQENLLVQPQEKQTDYLQLIRGKLIRQNPYINGSAVFLQKWIDKYGLEGMDFPFTEKQEILIMLSLFINQERELEYDLKNEIKNIQIDFFCYSASLEYEKAIDFIDGLLNKLENLKETQTAVIEFERAPQSEVQKSTPTPVEIPEGKPKTVNEKWYALHYLLELKQIGSNPPTNQDGNFIKSEIEKIGKERSGKSGQGFYRQFYKYVSTIASAASIERSFGKDWKQYVIEVSKNDADFIKFLKDNY